MLLKEVAKGILKGGGSKQPKLKGARVLNYHGVAYDKGNHLTRNFHSHSQFQDHLRILKYLKVISMDEFYSRLAANPKKMPMCFVLTFDDGFENNLVAGEMLLKMKLPFTVFVSTAPVLNAGLIWTVELSLLVLEGEAEKLEIFGETLSLKSKPERLEVFGHIRTKMKNLDADRRRLEFDQLRQQFPIGESERLADKFPQFKMLSPAQLGDLRNMGATIGSHGVDHEIHHQNQSSLIQKFELEHSRKELESLTGQSCDYFAYPNGNYNSDSEFLATKAGYKLAFTTEQGTVRPPCNLLTLPRIEAPGNLSRFIQKLFWK